ncbi:MAG: 3-oxoacyl-ACP reductase FabG [Actinomycetota bacterium]|nr:3-oxoacyl-ACP reductase FabG [Actinomycetota bacterium]
MASRVAFITGGSTGIGQACAVDLLEAGHKVAITYRSRRLDPAISQKWRDQLIEVACDVADTESIDGAIKVVEEKFGPVEILIVNAGMTADTLLLRMDESQFDKVIDTNLKGAFLLTKRVLPQMVRGRWGRIIYMSSVIAGMGAPGQANYAASKAGLIGFARSVAREVATRNITANVIAPGAVVTAMTEGLTEKRMEEMEGAIPMRRMAQPSDISGIVEFLSSDRANYITGTLIPVDGGLSMGF